MNFNEINKNDSKIIKGNVVIDFYEARNFMPNVFPTTKQDVKLHKIQVKQFLNLLNKLQKVEKIQGNLEIRNFDHDSYYYKKINKLIKKCSLKEIEGNLTIYPSTNGFGALGRYQNEITSSFPSGMLDKLEVVSGNLKCLGDLRSDYYNRFSIKLPSLKNVGKEFRTFAANVEAPNLKHVGSININNEIDIEKCPDGLKKFTMNKKNY